MFYFRKYFLCFPSFGYPFQKINYVEKEKEKIVIQFVGKKLLLHNAFQKILFLAKVLNLKKSIIRDEKKNPKSSITLIDDFLSLSLSHQTEKVHLKFKTFFQYFLASMCDVINSLDLN